MVLTTHPISRLGRYFLEVLKIIHFSYTKLWMNISFFALQMTYILRFNKLLNNSHSVLSCVSKNIRNIQGRISTSLFDAAESDSVKCYVQFVYIINVSEEVTEEVTKFKVKRKHDFIFTLMLIILTCAKINKL